MRLKTPFEIGEIVINTYSEAHDAYGEQQLKLFLKNEYSGNLLMPTSKRLGACDLFV